MEVELLHATPIKTVVSAIRKCYASEGKSDSLVVGGEFVLGIRDKELIRRIVSSGHLSTVEHGVYTFDIDGISRGCLQEFARHRIASLSVQSSRYCLTKLLKNEAPFKLNDGDSLIRAEKYLVTSNESYVTQAALLALENVRHGTSMDIPNDQLKYCLPESFKTSLVWTINARSLRNFLSLRLDKRAHWEIRELANRIQDLIPEDHKILFENMQSPD